MQMSEFEKKYKFDHIIKIEELSNEIEKLNNLYDLNLNCNFTSKHHQVKYNIEGDFSNLEFSKISKIPKYKNFYNDKTKNLVSKLYHDDIVKYNYSFEEFLETE